MCRVSLLEGCQLSLDNLAGHTLPGLGDGPMQALSLVARKKTVQVSCLGVVVILPSELS